MSLRCDRAPAPIGYRRFLRRASPFKSEESQPHASKSCRLAEISRNETLSSGNNLCCFPPAHASRRSSKQSLAWLCGRARPMTEFKITRARDRMQSSWALHSSVHNFRRNGVVVFGPVLECWIQLRIRTLPDRCLDTVRSQNTDWDLRGGTARNRLTDG